MINYVYILGTIVFTVYGQLILKWRIAGLGIEVPNESSMVEKILILGKLLLDPFVMSGFASAFIASLFWMIAMSKFELTHAYPFMSLAPALVLVFGFLALGEPMTLGKVLGLLFISAGIIITVKL